jgi:hypothetical protein
MSCGIVSNTVTGPSFFFTVKIITANSYPDMLQFFVVPQTDSSIQEENVKFCFNQTLFHYTCHEVHVRRTSKFIIRVLEGVDGRRCFHEVQASHH